MLVIYTLRLRVRGSWNPTSAKTGQIWGTRHSLERERSRYRQPSLTQEVREKCGLGSQRWRVETETADPSASPDFLSRVVASVKSMWFSLGRTTKVALVRAVKQEIRLRS